MKKKIMLLTLGLLLTMTACETIYDNPDISQSEEGKPGSEDNRGYKGLSAYFGTNLSGAEFAPSNQYPYGIDGQEYSFPPDRKSTRLNSSHYQQSRMPSSA